MPQPRVLVVDDQPSSAYLLATMAAACAETKTVVDGQEAINLAAAWQPDIVLLDLLMPGPDGFEIARQLRAQAPNAKIVAVSTLMPDDQRVQQAHFDRHLLKPVLKETVIETIRQLSSG